MIKIVTEKKNKKKKITPHYILKYFYMIGDADGNTSEKVKLSLDNPYIERYVTILNEMETIEGHWGIVLDEERIFETNKAGQLSDDDYNFLTRFMFEDGDSTLEIPKENEKFAYEFYEGVRADAEYSFLVFEGCELYYIDENGEKYKTKFV